ncbi:MAG TPA: hypothetical protein VGP93_05330 [Polyangiaceae bacterium]|nr:hypothetical protein [Polyangiaceae bacterium]
MSSYLTNSAADKPNATQSSPAASPVNYESTPLLETTLDGTDYRIDSGKQGTSLSISTRPSGSWDWTFGAEARWDGSMLRSRPFERPVREYLAKAFAAALAELE